MAAPITIWFTGKASGFDSDAFWREMRRPRRFVPVFVIGAVPILFFEVPRWLIPCEPRNPLEYLGATVVGLLFATMVMAGFARSTILDASPPFVLTFYADEILEERVGEKVAHPWSWITDVQIEQEKVTLRCAATARFRPGPAEVARVITLERSTPETELLLDVLAKRAVLPPRPVGA